MHTFSILPPHSQRCSDDIQGSKYFVLKLFLEWIGAWLQNLQRKVLTAKFWRKSEKPPSCETLCPPRNFAMTTLLRSVNQNLHPFSHRDCRGSTGDMAQGSISWSRIWQKQVFLMIHMIRWYATFTKLSVGEIFRPVFHSGPQLIMWSDELKGSYWFIHCS